MGTVAEVRIGRRRIGVARRLLGDARAEDDGLAEVDARRVARPERRLRHEAAEPVAWGALRLRVVNAANAGQSVVAPLLRIVRGRRLVRRIKEVRGEERHRSRDALAVGEVERPKRLRREWRRPRRILEHGPEVVLHARGGDERFLIARREGERDIADEVDRENGRRRDWLTVVECLLRVRVEEEPHLPLQRVGIGEVDAPEHAVAIADERPVGHRAGRRGKNDGHARERSTQRGVVRSTEHRCRACGLRAEGADDLACVQTDDGERSCRIVGEAAYLGAGRKVCVNERGHARGRA